jgi:hypothetical protein
VQVPAMSEGEPNDFEVIRDALLRLDPETRIQTIEAMKALRALPRPVTVRILADAGMRAALHVPRPLPV